MNQPQPHGLRSTKIVGFIFVGEKTSFIETHIGFVSKCLWNVSFLHVWALETTIPFAACTTGPHSTYGTLT